MMMQTMRGASERRSDDDARRSDWLLFSAGAVKQMHVCFGRSTVVRLFNRHGLIRHASTGLVLSSRSDLLAVWSELAVAVLLSSISGVDVHLQ